MEDEAGEASETPPTEFDDTALGQLNVGSHRADQSQPQNQSANMVSSTNVAVRDARPLPDEQDMLRLDVETVAMDFDFNCLQDSPCGMNAMSLYDDVIGPSESMGFPATQIMASRGGLLLTLPFATRRWTPN